jgi:steroid delta-isomerase-like uncharacterized protein
VASQAELERNKSVVRQMFESYYNAGDLAAAADVLAPDAVLHDPGTPRPIRHGPQYARVRLRAHLDGTPDLHYELLDIIAEGDLVAYRWLMTGTHRGTLLGVPATGARLSEAGTSFARIRDGKIVEVWHAYDALGLAHQLGLLTDELVRRWVHAETADEAGTITTTDEGLTEGEPGDR